MRDIHTQLTLLLVLALHAGCSGDKKDRPDDKKGDSAAKDADKPGDKVGKKPIEMAAKQYQDEFARDPEAAAKKYGGATVELTGVMATVVRAPDKRVILRLQGGPDSAGMECVLADAREWRKAMPGQPIKVSGKPDPKSPGTTLTDARITPVGAVPAQSVTAEALANAFAANQADAEMKYGMGKPAIITGELESVEFPGRELPKLYLKVPKGKVYVAVNFPDREYARKLKAGQRVKAWATEIGYAAERVGGHLSILYDPAE